MLRGRYGKVGKTKIQDEGARRNDRGNIWSKRMIITLRFRKGVLGEVGLDNRLETKMHKTKE